MKRSVAVLAFLAAVLASVPADAALLRITPQGLTPADYEALGYPLDPAEIPGSGFRLTFHGNGGDQLVNPVMLILAVPGALAAPGLTLGSTSGFSGVGVDLGDTATRYGGSWNTTTGFAGTFNASSTPNVYSYIGFAPTGSSSESYVNWSGATGLTSWNLFVYALVFDPLMNQGDYAEFNTSLPTGSFVIGYGCESLNTQGTNCGKQGDTESTPFTFAGRATNVAEPGSLALLLAGLAGLAVSQRRRSLA